MGEKGLELEDGLSEGVDRWGKELVVGVDVRGTKRVCEQKLVNKIVGKKFVVWDHNVPVLMLSLNMDSKSSCLFRNFGSSFVSLLT